MWIILCAEVVIKLQTEDDSSRIDGEWVTVPVFWYARCGDCPECKFEAVMANKSSVRGMPISLTRAMIARWKGE